MALDKTTLAQTIKTTFDNAKRLSWESDQVASALADAIHGYVTGADVIGVTVRVVDNASTPIGTGTQTGTGKLQ